VESGQEGALLESSAAARSELEALFLQLGLHTLEGASRTLVISGVSSAVGSSSVAQGLARVAAGVHRLPTVLVAMTAGSANASQEPGVCQLLDGQATVAQVARPAESPSLHRISLGGATLPLAGADLAGLIRTLEAEYRLVLLDAAPVLQQRVTALLASVAWGVVLVVRPRRNSRTQLSQTAALIEGSGGAIHGVVLNRIKESLPSWVAQNP
jgi:tyrosine-protein kinase Etk/Wzc